MALYLLLSIYLLRLYLGISSYFHSQRGQGIREGGSPTEKKNRKKKKTEKTTYIQYIPNTRHIFCGAVHSCIISPKFSFLLHIYWSFSNDALHCGGAPSGEGGGGVTAFGYL